ncbi:glycosyltransferase family 39 protein [Luteimicrobium subarcticum]|uniref:Dolichyl-phosphate-mannose-protein mannosyltransferase n=1 Tax=Luteimicrobium subarcticum TaxID=620910 RepID=A0A2M8WSI9_9MICO|nr:glycosyltransferase family 39 protein [Luteimicrobium subarcticum]PJI93796.1 dolichyl-phosphate-mannose-protein mannosyltransferase [Luteimicrobium subarcticum]
MRASSTTRQSDVDGGAGDGAPPRTGPERAPDGVLAARSRGRTTTDRTGGAAAVAWSAVLTVAAALLTVLLALAGRYGPHRDELYFVEAGRHLAWGYPDQPPLTPLLARAADLVAPGSLFALHTVAALAVAGTVVLSGVLAAELGGRSSAQVLTAVGVGTGAVVVALGHILSTATLDLLLWTAITYAVLRVLRRDDARGWLVVGLLGGLGVENKLTTALLLVAVALGVLLTPPVRHHLRTAWFWGAAGVVALIGLPAVLWQASHGWPEVTLAREIRLENVTVGGRVGYVALVLVLLGPLVTAIWVYGLVRLWRVPALGAARPFAWAFAALFVLFLGTGGKGYYLVGLLPVLVAAGTCGLVERWSVPEARRAVVILAVVGAIAWPASLPLLPARGYDGSFYAAMNADQAETIGWTPLVRAVDGAATVGHATAIVTANYGEAGALDWYGAPVPVYSGHNGYGGWGPPPGATGPIVLVGYDTAPDWASGCRTVARVDTGKGIDNQEQGASVMLCAGPAGTWSDVWPRVRHLDA